MSIQSAVNMQISQANSAVRLNRVETAGRLSPEEDRKLLEACKDFEAILIKQMLDSMRKTVNRSSLVPKNQGEEIFEDMLYQEYAEKMAESQPMGVSDMMYQQLKIQNSGDLY